MDGKHTARRSNNNFVDVWTDLGIEQTLIRSVKSRGGFTEGRGMTDSTRHLWVLSMSSTAYVHSSLMELTGTQTRSNEQHVELGVSRRLTDFNDCTKFYGWLQKRNPFLIENINLYSLSTGVVSNNKYDGVNCERAEEIGLAIQKTLDNMEISKCTVPLGEKLC